MDKIGFHEIFSQELMNKVHERFKVYMNEPLTEPFEKVIEREIFIDIDKVNVEKVMKNMDIQMSHDDILCFFTSNCYQFLIPKMRSEGHEFTQAGKTHFSGFVFFVENVEDRDYPHTSPSEQIDEFFKLSEEFIKSVFEFNIDDYVRDYKEFLRDNDL